MGLDTYAIKAPGEELTEEDGLADNLVRTVLEDREGNMWFGTYPYAEGKGGSALPSVYGLSKV